MQTSIKGAWIFLIGRVLNPMTKPTPKVLFSCICSTLILLGCSSATVPVVGNIAGTGMEMYAQQAGSDAMAATLTAPPGEIYAGILRLADRSPELNVVNTDPDRLEIELAQDDYRLTTEATEFSDRETLLHIWIDTDNSRLPPRDYVRSFLQQLSSEMRVKYEILDM